VIEVAVESESGAREFLLNPRRGMSAVCMCKLENIETSTTLRLIDDTSEFIMVKGHIGTALIEITDTVLTYLVEKSRRGEPSEVPIQAIIDLAIMSTEMDGNLKLYWVAPRSVSSTQSSRFDYSPAGIAGHQTQSSVAAETNKEIIESLIK